MLNPELTEEQISAISLAFFESGIIEYIKAHKDEYKEFLKDELDK